MSNPTAITAMRAPKIPEHLVLDKIKQQLGMLGDLSQEELEALSQTLVGIAADCSKASVYGWGAEEVLTPLFDTKT